MTPNQLDTPTAPAPERVARVREVFDEWAVSGRAEGMEQGHGPTARPAFEGLVGGAPAGLRYLDIGCGNGYTVRWAASRFPAGEAVGVDLSSAMIERARAASRTLANARFEVADFASLDQSRPALLRPGSFDAVFSMEVFYYLPDLDAALREVFELLRPGGRFVCLVDYYGENPASHDWPARLGVEMTLLDAAGWAAAFTRAGFEGVSSERLRPDPSEAAYTSPIEPWKLEQGSLSTMGRRPA